MKIAVIGTSWITEKFIAGVRYNGLAEICGVYSRTEAKGREFAEKLNIQNVYTSLEALAASDMDAVYIASPNSLHYSQSKLMLEHGKHVICEKPATTTENEMRELLALAHKNNLIYTEAIMSMYVPAFDILKEQIAKIGNIRTANIVYCQLSSKYPAFLEGKNPNIFNPEFHTGCLADIGVYNVFLAAGLFGMPDDIISKSTFLSSGADSQGTAVLVYTDKTVNLVYSKVGQSYSPSEFIGDKGTVSVNAVSQLTGIDFVDKNGRINIVDYNIGRDEIMSHEANFFIRGCNGDTKAIKKINSVNEIALFVRKISDEIRKQNNFPF